MEGNGLYLRETLFGSPSADQTKDKILKIPTTQRCACRATSAQSAPVSLAEGPSEPASFLQAELKPDAFPPVVWPAANRLVWEVPNEDRKKKVSELTGFSDLDPIRFHFHFSKILSIDCV